VTIVNKIFAPVRSAAGQAEWPNGEMAKPAAPPTLSVVTVSWNDWSKLRTCLQSIYRAAPPTTQVIVIDNHSTDGTVQRMRDGFPQVESHENATNLGHTRGINQGLDLARGEYILVLDSDTELAADCIALLTEFMEARPDVMMVAPRTFNTDGSVQESARNFPGVMSGLFGRQSLLTRLFPRNRYTREYLRRDFLDRNEPFQVEQIGGACMFFRRALLEAVGPWDQRYVGYWVDTDWCRRLQQQNLPIYCEPRAHITHHEGNARGKRKTPHRIWIFHRGAYQYYTKWHCRGAWDPRSIIAGIMLSGRAALQIALNATTTHHVGVATKPAPLGRDSGKFPTVDWTISTDQSNRL
jgi:hypothetical protein